MSAAPVPRLSIHEAIEVIWQRIKAGQAGTVSEAIDLGNLPLSPAADLTASRAGLIYLANNAQHKARERRQPIAFGRPHGAKDWADYMAVLSMPYVDSDGTEKSLIDFTVKDMRFLAQQQRQIGDGYYRTASAATGAAQEMSKAKVNRLGDLSADKLTVIASEFDKAFR